MLCGVDSFKNEFKGIEYFPVLEFFGDVIEINLSTVKVQNFDKTITTIPTYALISDSFKNWRGMENSGGRRIKRAVVIKQSSICYLSQEKIEELKKIMKEIISSNPESVTDYKNGKESLLQFFVGQGMKATKGSGNPELLKSIALDMLK